jgi:ribosomal protein L11 methyltransferase
MSWIEVKAVFAAPLADTSPIVEVFRSFGVDNTQEDGDSVTGCITDVAGAETVANELAECLAAAGASKVFLAPLIEGDWELAWRKFFKPRRVGQRFVIQPTWEERVAQPEDIELLLDPGQAFGTGDHPTTRMCLELLDALDLMEKRVLDLGCGSGILAIAAAKMHALVTASDIDPIAVEVARENAVRNQVQIELWAGDGLTKGLPLDLSAVPQDEQALTKTPAQAHPVTAQNATYDLVLSNIISATLIRLARDISSVIGPGGGWIVSGIIESNWPEVARAAEAAEFDLAEERREDGWVAARFTRRTTGE